MASAKILTLCDALVTEIDTAWTQGAGDTITRKYIAGISTEELSTLTGRHVYVFPAEYTSEGATRDEDEWTYTVAILTVERYTDAGEAISSWLDTRVDFVEATVRNAVNFTGRSLLTIATTRRIRTESIEIETYNLEMLNEKNLFWSEMTLTMKEVASV